jgi:hypothetical protein
MDKIIPEPMAANPAIANAVDIRQLELAEIVSILENSLERIEALGLPLVAALLDHAIAVAKRQSND